MRESGANCHDKYAGSEGEGRDYGGRRRRGGRLLPPSLFWAPATFAFGPLLGLTSDTLSMVYKKHLKIETSPVSNVFLNSD